MKNNNSTGNNLTEKVPIKHFLLIMRAIVILLFTCIFCSMAEIGYTQNARVTINKRNSTLQEILNEIEKQTDYLFIYNNEVKTNEKVSVRAKHEAVSKVLAVLLKDKGVNYSMEGNHIILSMVEKTTLTEKEYQADIVQQQKKQIIGTITDVNGTPIIGANVVEVGTTNGTVTNVNGNFSLGVENDAVIRISYIGYFEQVIKTEGEMNFNIMLQEDTQALEELIVVGYSSMKKINLTGAISNIQSDDISRSLTSTVSQALVGKMPGIQSRSLDGRPGESAQLQIRNMGEPLYIIDGIPGTGSDFNNIDLNNIENISILKDASAAIYGLRAGNGVVLVTTKLGTMDETPRINVNAYYGIQGFTRFPKQANAYQYMRGLAESAQNLNQVSTITQIELDRWKTGQKLPDGDYRSMDYYDYMINTSPQFFINSSATGGTDKYKYHFSIGHLDQRATLTDYYFKRSSVQANMEASLAKKFRVGTQINGRVEHRHQPGVPGDDYSAAFNVVTKMWPIERPYANDNPDYINNTHSINVNPATYVEDVTGYNDIINRVARTNFYAIYDFDFGLQLKGTYSYQYRGWTDENFEYTYDAYEYDPATDTYNVVVGGGNQNPNRRTTRQNVTDNFAQFQLSYDKIIASHSLSAVFAYEMSETDNTRLHIRTVPQTNYLPTMLFEELAEFNDTWDQQARGSYIGRINYNFKGRYLLELLGRYDGSYRYSPDTRWGFFPGMSVGWRISDEPFFTDIFKNNIISDLKLRASYGETGSEIGVSDFGFIGGFNWGQGNYIFDGNLITGIQSRGLPVTNLSWVTNETTNLGLDFSLFNNNLYGQFDVFKRKVTGIPAARYDVLLPSEVGYSLPNENLNSTANLGIEGLLAYRGRTNNLNYNIGVNATLTRQRTLETYKPRFGNSWDEYRNSVENRWSDVTWGYQIVGQFQSQEEIDNHLVNIDGQGNRTLLPGDLIYKDINQDGIINSYDERPIAYRITRDNPYLNFGVNCSFNYKRFHLAMDFSGATIQSLFLARELQVPFYSNGNSPSFLLEDRWHRKDPFDPTSEWIKGTYPAIRKGLDSHSNFNRRNDFYHVNMSYFRMKNFEFGYTFPLTSLGKKNEASTMKLYTNITNLFSIDNVGRRFGIDPEIADFGGRVYPLTRVFNFGFVLSL